MSHFQKRLDLLLKEAFEPWSYHKRIVANPHVDDIITMLKLLKKNFELNRAHAFLSDMIPEWRKVVFPKLPPNEIEIVINALRQFGLNEKQLIYHGVSKDIEVDPSKSGMQRVFAHESNLKNVMNYIMHDMGEWADMHPNAILDIIENNAHLMEKLDPDFVAEFEKFLDRRIDDYNQKPQFGDVLNNLFKRIKDEEPDGI